MRTHLFSIAILGTLALGATITVGCGSRAAEPDPPALAGSAEGEPAARPPSDLPSTATLWFEPGDGMTHVEGTPVRVGVRSLSFARGTALLASLGDQIRLETWPEREAVPARVSIDAPRTDEPTTEGEAIVTLTPRAPLPDRWYVVTAKSPSIDLEATPGAPVARIAARTIGARFRTGSEPRVAAVRVCGEGAAARVFLDLSEAVSDPLAATGDDPKATGPRLVRTLPRAIPDPSGAPRARLRVEAPQGLRGETGAALVHAPIDVDLRAAVPWGECAIVRL